MTGFRGLMWMDNSPTDPLETKLGRAVEYYLNKHGTPPTLCYCNPSQVGGLTRYGECEVRANKHIRRNHFWVGVAEMEAQA